MKSMEFAELYRSRAGDDLAPGYDLMELGEDTALALDPGAKLSEEVCDGETVVFFTDGSTISFSVALSR